MDWMKKMNDVSAHIEANLTEHVSYETLARMVGCSAYEFSRLFSFIAGVPVSEYIRRRRLSEAVFHIQRGKEKIIDIALKYGYETPSTFARAFKEMHGVTPVAARKSGTELLLYPPISFVMSITGVGPLRFRLEKREAFKLYGKMELLELDASGVYGPQFVNRQMAPLPETLDTPKGMLSLVDAEKGIYEGGDGLKLQMEKRKNMLFGVSASETAVLPEMNVASAIFYKLQDGKVMRFIGVELPINKVSVCESEVLEIPAANFAVFAVESDTEKDVMAQAYTRILTEWLPSSHYRRDETTPHLERHPLEGTKPWEIWIPVVEKGCD